MEEISVTQAAEKLGKTDRTIRNYIKQGRIKARHVENQFGWEYRIFDFGEFTDRGKPCGKVNGNKHSSGGRKQGGNSLADRYKGKFAALG